jgi:hypothetical protein
MDNLSLYTHAFLDSERDILVRTWTRHIPGPGSSILSSLQRISALGLVFLLKQNQDFLAKFRKIPG